MLDYVVRRLMLGLVTLFGVAVMVFFVMRVLPGDAAVMLSGAGAGAVSEKELAGVRAKLGLDRPLPAQFADWAGNVAVLELGTSLRTGNPVIADVARRFPYTLQIVVMAMLIAVLIGVPVGVLSAAYAGSWGDQILRALSIGGLAAPSFWVGLLLILLLVWLFQWSAPLVWEPFWVSPWKSVTQLFWPALAVGLRQLALIARMTRSIMLEVLGEDYIRTARAKGVSEFRVLWKHARNGSLLPVVSFLGPGVADIVTGSIVVEKIFAIPGLGRFFVEAAFSRDYTTVLGTVLFYAVLLIIANLAVDIFYKFLDPRIEYQ